MDNPKALEIVGDPVLGDLDRRLRAGSAGRVLVAGITYDPAYDLPGRLAAYGRDRSLEFSDTCQLLRTTGPFEPLAERLRLGVGFGQNTVNIHRIEWLLADPAGHVRHAGTRKHWNEDEVAETLSALSPAA